MNVSLDPAIRSQWMGWDPWARQRPMHTGIRLCKSDSRISFAVKLQQKNVQIMFSVKNLLV